MIYKRRIGLRRNCISRCSRLSGYSCCCCWQDRRFPKSESGTGLSRRTGRCTRGLPILPANVLRVTERELALTTRHGNTYGRVTFSGTVEIKGDGSRPSVRDRWDEVQGDVEQTHAQYQEHEYELSLVNEVVREEAEEGLRQEEDDGQDGRDAAHDHFRDAKLLPVNR